MSLTTPENIRRFQRKLYRKAKCEPACRFHQLYDKVYRVDILEHAYRKSKNAAGSPGVDGVSYEDIESNGVADWLAQLQEELRSKTYNSDPVKRVMIPKPNGGERPLGIPTIRDRVVQTAAKLVLEPIFEADLDDSAYGYRPKRCAQDAIGKVHKLLYSGYTDVVDADLSGYFDTIPHHELMQSVARRISDRHMLRLIKSWLKTPIVEKTKQGKQKVTGGKRSRKGVPQGGVISPLLANLYMNRFLKAWRNSGKDYQFNARIVNYADDFVILSRGRADDALAWTRWVMDKLKLTINEQKTSIRDVRTESLDFLGYTFGIMRWYRDGHTYLGAKPSKKSVQRLKDKVRNLLKPWNHYPLPGVVTCLNRILRGWSNYFQYGSLRKTAYAVDKYVYDRMRNFLRRRHKVASRGTKQFPAQYVWNDLGVFRFKTL